MKKDLIIGFVVSIGIHAGFLFGFGEGGEEERVVSEEAPTMELVEMPEIEPEPPEEIVEGDASEEVPLEFAPPMQADVPSTVTVDSFVQPMQPPPPPSAPVAHGAVTIPVHRTAPTTKLANLFDIKDLDQIPQPTYQAQPNYPYELKQQGVTGTVVLGFVVDSTGKVRDIYVVRSSNPGFERPAIEALEKWRFRAGKKTGKTVNTRMLQPFTFSVSK